MEEHNQRIVIVLLCSNCTAKHNRIKRTNTATRTGGNTELMLGQRECSDAVPGHFANMNSSRLIDVWRPKELA